MRLAVGGTCWVEACRNPKCPGRRGEATELAFEGVMFAVCLGMILYYLVRHG